MFLNEIASCEQGLLRGYTVNDVTVFKGISYAKPPVGELRWREPMAPDHWRGIRDARYYRASPLQSVSGADSGEEIAWMDEDCLYLNIWTPAKKADEKLPVFLWIYGGGFQTGRGDDPATEGQKLAEQGIVAVTINYRLNVFGFLCHPDMKAESPYGTGGNFGLLDQIAALKWVHKNIENFGGDPEKITICGQSAGSMSVYNLAVSPCSRDLINGMICESGDAFFHGMGSGTFEEAAEKGAKLCEYLGCSSLDEMRKLPADRFVRLGYDVMRTDLHFGDEPVVDGKVLPRPQGLMLLQNDCAQVPLVTGTTSDEGFGRGDEYVMSFCEQMGIDPAPYLGNAKKLAVESWFARTAAWTGLRAEKYGLPTFQYLFSAPDGDRGAQHCAEVPYVFGTLDNKMTYCRQTPAEEGDWALSRELSARWVQFVKTGSPNGEGLQKWASKGEEASFLNFNREVKAEKCAKDQDMAALIEATEKWLLKAAEK